MATRHAGTAEYAPPNNQETATYLLTAWQPEIMIPLDESSFNALYKSTVLAFPHTGLRQHATQPIKIVHLEWMPYLGLKTLYVRGLAQNITNGHEYNPIILFKKVNYQTEQGKGVVKLQANDGGQYLFEQLSYQNTDILVRCNCKDFRFRFAYFDHLDHSLYGRKPKKYEAKGVGPPANPLELPGMCKHVLATVKVLENAGIFCSV